VGVVQQSGQAPARGGIICTRQRAVDDDVATPGRHCGDLYIAFWQVCSPTVARHPRRVKHPSGGTTTAGLHTLHPTQMRVGAHTLIVRCQIFNPFFSCLSLKPSTSTSCESCLYGRVPKDELVWHVGTGDGMVHPRFTTSSGGGDEVHPSRWHECNSAEGGTHQCLHLIDEVRCPARISTLMRERERERERERAVRISTDRAMVEGSRRTSRDLGHRSNGALQTHARAHPTHTRSSTPTPTPSCTTHPHTRAGPRLQSKCEPRVPRRKGGAPRTYRSVRHGAS
jgi:hypothetical protein